MSVISCHMTVISFPVFYIMVISLEHACPSCPILYMKLYTQYIHGISIVYSYSYFFWTLQGPTGRLVPQDRRWACCSSAAHHGICRSGLQHNFPDTQLGRPAWSTLANVYLHGPGSGVGSCKRAAFLTGDTDKTVCLTGSRHHEDWDQCNNE